MLVTSDFCFSQKKTSLINYKSYLGHPLQIQVSMYYMAEKRKNFTLFKRFKRFKRLPSPKNTPNASSNFSNFRNYPNYFRFPIYKFISQKIFSSFISHDQHDERYKN